MTREVKLLGWFAQLVSIGSGVRTPHMHSRGSLRHRVFGKGAVIKCFLHLGVAHIPGSVSPITGGQNIKLNAEVSKPCLLLSPSMGQLLNYTALGVCLACKPDWASMSEGLVNRTS